MGIGFTNKMVKIFRWKHKTKKGGRPVDHARLVLARMPSEGLPGGSRCHRLRVPGQIPPARGHCHATATGAKRRNVLGVDQWHPPLARVGHGMFSQGVFWEENWKYLEAVYMSVVLNVKDDEAAVVSLPAVACPSAAMPGRPLAGRPCHSFFEVDARPELRVR